MGVEEAHEHVQYAVTVHQNYQQMSRTRSSSSSFMIPKWLRLKSSKTIDIVEEMKYTDDDDDDAVSSSSSSMVTSTSSSSSSSSSDHSKNMRSNKNKKKTGMNKEGAEPASPKIGCMGQIKQQQKQKQKNKNEDRYSKIDEDGIFLTTNHQHHQQTSSRKSNNNNSNYFKLKNILFTATGTGSRSNSFRLSTSTSTSAVATTGRSNSSRAMINVDRHRKSASKPPMSNEHHHHHHKQQLQIDILELDPPLPVVKRTPPPLPPTQNSSTIAQEGEAEVVIGDLWRRRRFGSCGGDGDGKTSLKGLQLENSKHKPATFLVPLPLTL